MNARVSTRRKNAFNLFREVGKLSSFDEFPMLRPEIDPQVHLSRNTVDQPFHLLCEKDTVLAQFSGRTRLVFRDGAVRYFDLDPGDYVYVPAGRAHRVLTLEAGAVLRYKAARPGAEAAVWYCETCGEELDRHVFDADAGPVQAGYQFAAERHNAEPERRFCAACGAVHDPIDLSPFRWSAVAEALVADDADL